MRMNQGENSHGRRGHWIKIWIWQSAESMWWLKSGTWLSFLSDLIEPRMALCSSTSSQRKSQQRRLAGGGQHLTNMIWKHSMTESLCSSPETITCVCVCVCVFSCSASQFIPSVVSDSLRPHGLQDARPPCPSPTPGVYPNPCPLRQWCHPTISSSVVPFSSCLQSFPASGSFPMS